jgi:REP-associated tyrosine transposase
MRLFSEEQRRRPNRYPGYDYTLPGAYFVTIVSNHRDCLFGVIVSNIMRLNIFGNIVAQTWEWLAQQYPFIDVYPYIVMPNHFHGILHLQEPVGAGRVPPLRVKYILNHRDN